MQTQMPIRDIIAYVPRRYRTRKRWLTPRRLTVPLSRVRIDRPVFLLGVQGGGLTVLLKCLQRLDNTCFCHGNRNTWDAADNEMHVCVDDPQMPPELSFLGNPHYPKDLPSNFYRYWTYATNRTVGGFRIEPDDVDANMRDDFRAVVKKIIRAHAIDLENCRYIDKSQLYTICLAALHSILEDTNPFFVLVGRDPLGCVPRTARNYYLNPRKHGYDMAYRDALRLCAEHWNNSFRLALEDGERVKNFMTMRVEDFFAAPEPFLRKICDFAELDFTANMVPGPGQLPTIYQQMGRRWYPLERSATDEARQQLSDEERAIIVDICGTVMSCFGYG